ncbi:MAG: hypothetical protein ACKKMS_02460 [Candidatus Nealsonbacteria bacterium]
MEEKRARNLEIIKMRRKKITLAEIGKEYKISPARVWYVVKNTRRKLRIEKRT